MGGVADPRRAPYAWIMVLRRSLHWALAVAPWVLCAALCAGYLRVLPRASPAEPVLRESRPPRPPEPAKPKAIEYDPRENVPS